jgi:hypothetical protein
LLLSSLELTQLNGGSKQMIHIQLWCAQQSGSGMIEGPPATQNHSAIV